MVHRLVRYLQSIYCNLKLIFSFSVSQINARHNFLDRFIGTKKKEDISYGKATEVNLCVTVTTCVCCMLEMALYFAYNRMVNNNVTKY